MKVEQLSTQKKMADFELNQISLEEKIEEMAINFTQVRSAFFSQFYKCPVLLTFFLNFVLEKKMKIFSWSRMFPNSKKLIEIWRQKLKICKTKWIRTPRVRFFFIIFLIV